jgi:peptidoglycan/xylan/chitin deacetylase (PgdA/CDA1 family)
MAMPLLLMYHSVDRVEHDPYRLTVTPERFVAQLDWFRARGMRGVGARELLSERRSGNARGLVGLTFDDGYADFATEVTPLLRWYGFTATVFVVADRIGGHNAWDEGPRRPLMTADQLRQVARLGMEIASHGLTHVSLPQADPDELKAETVMSRAILQEIIGAEVTGFAYPYGHVDGRAVEAVRDAGYDYACAIWHSGVTGIHALARTYIGQRDGALRLRAKVIRHELTWRTRT